MGLSDDWGNYDFRCETTFRRVGGCGCTGGSRINYLAGRRADHLCSTRSNRLATRRRRRLADEKEGRKEVGYGQEEVGSGGALSDDSRSQI